jgi:GTP-binding protein
MFVDQVKVSFAAGGGGNGCLSFRREKYIPRGGPDGGRGGEGGRIFLVSDSSVKSLAYFRFHPHIKARRGAHGEGGNRQGKKGENRVFQIPVGTIVREKDSDTVLHDFTAPNQKYLVAKGGMGGRGNASFASSVNQAPRRVDEGKPGEERDYVLELKLIADVGLVGFPNAGKSTLISVISAAKPVIADYPFTTLVPNLGVVDYDETRSFVVADIPGLIEGAHLGQGLGIRFLRHVERTKVLVHLVDVSPYTQRDPVDDYRTVIRELEAFDPGLIKRPQILVANKTDLLGDETQRLKKLESLAAREGLPFFPLSALKRIGTKELVQAMARELKLAG